MPAKRRIRVILDANWFISACISRNSRRTIWYNILHNDRLQTYYSLELIGEFDGVMSRKKFAKKVTPMQVKRFRTLALLFMKRVVSAPVSPLSRDPNDDYLLGICKASRADFLITGDDDLFTLRNRYCKHESVSITPAFFVSSIISHFK